MKTENILNDSRLRALENHTRVNLLRPTLGTTTIDDVTCTNNGDGTYSVNGTAKKNTDFIVGTITLKKGQYKVIGCPKNGSYESYSLRYRPNADVWTGYLLEYGDGIETNLSENKISDVVITISSGFTANNLIFKPMLTTDLSATYDNFVSYEDSLQPGINTGLKMDLLWENASLGSNFASQIINVPTYNQYAIIVVGANYSGHSQIFFVKPGASYVLGFPNYKNGVIGQRALDIGKDGLYFGTGYSMDSYHTQNGNNSVAIPYRIYGVK